MKLIDQSLMTFGKYKGEKLEDIPARYFLFLWNDFLNEESYSIGGYGALRKYIIENMTALEKDSPDTIITNDPRLK